MGSGGAGSGDAKRVVVKKIELHSDDLKQPLIMDLTLAPEKIKEQTFKVKEGAEYQLHFFFQVNNEILSGLRYSQVNSQYQESKVGASFRWSFRPNSAQYRSDDHREDAPHFIFP